MIFVKETRSKISKANPDMPVLQIMKEVGHQWQSLKPDEKAIYQAKADEDKIRYKEQLKEFEKEVEKLQVEKPGKGKSKNVSKKKVEDTVESPILKPDPPKSPQKTQETKIIDVDEAPKILPRKAEPEKAENSESLMEIFCKEYSEIFKKNYKLQSNMDAQAKAKESWARLSERDKSILKHQPNQIRSLVFSDLQKLQEESKNKPQPYQTSPVKNDNLIKRPMNIERQPAYASKPPTYIPPKMSMGYKMTAEPSPQKHVSNDADGVTLASNTNMGEE
jgi:hypothetical protein